MVEQRFVIGSRDLTLASGSMILMSVMTRISESPTRQAAVASARCSVLLVAFLVQPVSLLFSASRRISPFNPLSYRATVAGSESPVHDRTFDPLIRSWPRHSSAAALLVQVMKLTS